MQSALKTILIESEVLQHTQRSGAVALPISRNEFLLVNLCHRSESRHSLFSE